MKLPLGILSLLLVAQAGLQAATFTVTNSNNSGAGSLRQAVIDANVTAGADTINFDTAGHFSVARTITLTSGQITILNPVTINGPATSANAPVTISGNSASRAFDISANAATVTFRRLTMRFGAGDYGGAMQIPSGVTTTLEDCVLRNNGGSTIMGGGIYAEGAVVFLTNCTIAQNEARYGGGIALDNCTATITGGSIGENEASILGGGIYCYFGDLAADGASLNANQAPEGGGLFLSWTDSLVRNCTISANAATAGNGGGAHIESGYGGATVDLANCTFSGNSATAGGAVFAEGPDTYLDLTNCTVTLNFAEQGGGISADISDLRLANSIVASNTATADMNYSDLHGDVDSAGSNLIGIRPLGIGEFVPIAGDRAGTVTAPLNPLLGPLQDNGGETLTHALLFGSPAIEAGNSSKITDPPFAGPDFKDQTGAARMVGTVDMGAVEFPAFEVTNTNDSGPGSLRDVAAQANGLGGGVITFKSSVFNASKQTIGITSGVIAISSNVSILAPEVGVRIDGQNSWRIFNVSVGQVTMEGLELYRGQHAADGGAVSIFGTGTSLKMRNCRVTDSQANGNGGGIFLGNASTFEATDCAFLDNSSILNGGGGLFLEGSTQLTNCTVAGNTAARNGGGLTFSGPATLINCTVVENTADSDGNGDGDGGGMRRGSGVVEIGNTVVANNVDATAAGTLNPDISGSYTSLGHNLIGKSDGGTGFTNNANGDKVGTIAAPLDPLLSARVDDAFYLPNGLSPAVNAGDNALLDHSAWLEAPERDQRGQFRTVDGTVEIGAVEWPSLTVIKLTVADGEASEHGLNVAKFRLRRSLTDSSFAAQFAVDAASTASSGDYALSGPSYTSIPHSVTFAQGDDTVLVTVTPTQDSVVEGTETVVISLVASGYYVDPVLTNTRSIDIIDNEFIVTSSADSGPGTLRDAVATSTNWGGGKITIPSPLCITLGGSPLVINGDIEIIGNASTISAGGKSRVFEITGDGGGCVKLQGLAISHGVAPANENGGGIYAESACVEIRSCAITQCQGDSGGGVYADFTCPELTILNSSFCENSARRFSGGGIGALADLNTLTNVTIGRNTALGDGGGLDLGILNSSILTNCTITENTSDLDNDNTPSGGGNGGGLYWASGTLTLNNSVITDNFDTPGNAGAGDIHPNLSTLSGFITTGGGNFVGNRVGVASLIPSGTPNGNGDYAGTNAAPLDALLTYQYDLRPFYTFPPSSLLQNHGVNALNAEPNDMRGRPRTVGTMDIGAVEMNSFLVSNTDGGNTLGSLRRAINNANAAGGGDIVFDEQGLFSIFRTITFGSSGQLAMTTPISIFGPAATAEMVTSTGRLCSIAPTTPASIYLSRLNFTGGNADATYVAGSRDGGGIHVGANAALTLQQVIFADCLADEDGGGLFVSVGGSVLARDCRFDACEVEGSGGAIANEGVLRLERSLLTTSGTRSGGNGGGIYTEGDTKLLNSTLYANHTNDNGDGGAVYAAIGSGEFLEVRHCTLVGNQARGANGIGGGIYRAGLLGTVNIENTLLDQNTADSGQGHDLFGLILSRGHNIVSRNTSVHLIFPEGHPNGNADYAGTAAYPVNYPLTTLLRNGGPTFSIRPLCGNPAIDGGRADGSCPTDQRGLGRIHGTAPDIGAYELQPEPYAYWASHSFLDPSGPLTGEFDDYDGDGEENALEYLADSTATIGSSIPSQKLGTTVAWNGTTFTFSAKISPLALPTAYRVRFSTDLANWTLAPTATQLGDCALDTPTVFSRVFGSGTPKVFGRIEYLQGP